MRQGIINQIEIIIRIQHIQYRNGLLIGNICATEGYQLVENRQGVTHSTICFLRHYIQCLLAHRDSFVRRHFLQVSNRIRNGDPVEIIHLATTQNRR